MKILVLGAKGMLGCELHRHFEAAHEVTALDSSSCDIASPEECRRVIRDLSPDVVVNAAAYTNVDGCETDRERCFSVNAEGVKNIALACRDRGSLIVHFSTDYVFDGTAGVPYREDDPTNPINAYGASKLQGERFLAEYADRWLLLRTSWLYGVHGKNFVSAILARTAVADRLEVVHDQVGSPTFAGDLAWAAGVLIEQKKAGVYHIANGGRCSWHAFACKILEYAGKREFPVRPIPSSELTRAAVRPAWSVLSTDKFSRETGREMRRWETALKDYLAEIGVRV